MVKIEHLTKQFQDTVILEDASYEFPNRGLVCLLGPSGSGKSTLLNLLAGFDSDYQGTIISCDQNLRELGKDALCAYRRDQVGFIFQNYHLMPGFSVLDNVLTSAELLSDTPVESRRKASSLLTQLGLGEKAQQKAETLSGGQKQRVAIARALMGDPQFILADEPTGALDRQTSNEIMELLKKLSQNRLVLVITHDAKVCEYADEVLHIQNKKIVAERSVSDKGESIPAAPAQAGSPSPKKRAGKNFKVHLSRYMAAALSISIGLLAFLFSLSFGNVMEREISRFQEKNTVFNNGYIRGEDDGTILSYLQEDVRIENAYYQYVLNNVTLSCGGRTETIDEKLPLPKTGEALSYGVMPRRGENEIALSPSLAKKFSANIQELPGQTVALSVNEKKYELTVSGIYNAGYDDFFVSSDVEQALYEGLPEQENYSISYDVKEFQDVVAVNNALKLRGISAKNASNEVYAFQQSFRELEKLFTVISLLVLMMALFLCAVLLYKLQNSRYRELGLLSALGFREHYLRSMIRWENLYLSAFSAAVTAVLGLLSKVVCAMANFPLEVGPIQLLLSMAGAFLAVICISTLSSVKLIRTEPAEALKHT